MELREACFLGWLQPEPTVPGPPQPGPLGLSQGQSWKCVNSDAGRLCLEADNLTKPGSTEVLAPSPHVGAAGDTHPGRL